MPCGLPAPAGFPIAVVEAKAKRKQAGESLQQARERAELPGLTFAYATNGAVEVDCAAGIEREVAGFPAAVFQASGPTTPSFVSATTKSTTERSASSSVSPSMRRRL